MSVPSATLGPLGFVVPDQATVLAAVLADLDTSFGGGLNLALDTPQGQLASSITAIVGDANDQFLALANGVDPAYAAGRLQDAIGRIYYITRNPAQPTSVEVLCTGLAGVPIPTGALVKATDGNLYNCVAGDNIGGGGTVILPFVCNITGPVVCPANTVTTIYQSIPGWDTATNVADGVLGNDVESRAAFEARRAQSVAKNAVGSLPAILGSVLAVPNVLDAYVTENPTNGTVTIGGFALAPSSLYVAVVGGDPQAIANAIWEKKAPGAAYNGNTTETVTDPSPIYSTPPTYAVTYEIPAGLSILFAVQIKSSTSVPSNATTLIKAAIISAFAGADGGPRARIGSTILASRFYSTIAALGAWAQIVSILIGTSSPTLNSVTVGIAQTPTVSSGGIAVSYV